MRFTPNTCHNGSHDSGPACDVYRANVVSSTAVGTLAVESLRVVAIPAKDLETQREALATEPSVEASASNRSTKQLPSVSVPSVLDVIDCEKFLAGLAAASAQPSVVVQYRRSDLGTVKLPVRRYPLGVVSLPLIYSLLVLGLCFWSLGILPSVVLVIVAAFWALAELCVREIVATGHAQALRGALLSPLPHPCCITHGLSIKTPHPSSKVFPTQTSQPGERSFLPALKDGASAPGRGR